MGARLCAFALLALVGAAAPAFAEETIRVAIDKLVFAPARVSAHVGDTIEWVNHDAVAHTATASNKDWEVALAPAGTGRVTLRHAGEIDYFCRFHPNMTGHLTVAP